MTKKKFDIPNVELGMRYALWRDSIRGEPTAREVMKEFGCAKSTALRWNATWRDVTGVPALGVGQHAKRDTQ